MALSYKNDPEEDERLNPATQAKDLYNQEQAGYDRELSDIENNFDDTADSSQEDENIEKSKNIDKARQEEGQPPTTFDYSPSGKQDKKKLTLKGVIKKGGPLGIIGTVLLGGGGLSLFFFSPGLLLVQMKEIFTNYGSSASRAAPARYNKMLKYTINNPKVKAACASNPASKKCTLGTMSETQRANYEKAGFKINGEDVDGRTRITSVEFPDGKKVTSGNGFINHSRKSVAAASAARKAYNPATQVFNGGRFSSNVLKRFGLNKTKEDVSGKNDKERKTDFNKRTGNDISDDERSSRFKAKYESRIRNGATPNKLSRFTNVLGLACAGYNIAKITTAAVKVENGLRFTAFAFQFLKAADQIKNNGDIKPETASFLGGVLTATAISGDKEKIGLSATDSQGYKIAAYGGEGLLKKFTQAFLLGGNPILILIDNTVQSINKMAGGRQNVRTACRGAGNLALVVGLIAAICAGQALAEGGSGTMIVPGLGTLAGLITGVITCAMIEVIVAIFFSYLVGFMVGQALPKAIEMLANAKLDVNEISGVDAGNAMAVGAGVMLGTTALSRGLKAGSKNDVTTFLAATADDKAQMDQIAMYDSKDEPFNIYNEYSFLGSTVRKMGVALHVPSSSSEILSSLGAIISSPLRLLSPNAGASPASMPVSISNADLSACPDNDMKDIGIDCDKMGNPQFVLSPKELDMEVSDNLEYMRGEAPSNATVFIEEDGTEIPGTAYVKWLTNCTEQREAPMGATFMSVEEDDYYWGTGENCVKASEEASEEDLSNFRVYYNSLGEKEDGDYSEPKATDEVALSFKLMSYNIITSDQTDMQDGTRGDGYPIDSVRYKNAAKIITDSGAGVIGMQEIGPADRRLINDNLTGYSSFPTSAADSSNHGNLLPIYWKSDTFSLVEGGTIAYPWSVCPGLTKCANAIWVRLRDTASSKEFYVTNIHMTNERRPSAGGGDGADQREASAKILNEFAADKGIPVFSVGDFNSSWGLTHDDNSLNGDRSRIPYCVMTESVFNNAFDVFSNKTGKCPTQANEQPYQIDHIYTSKKSEVTVDEYKVLKNDLTRITSDHNPVLANIVFPVSGINVASFNIYHSENQADAVWKARLKRSLNVLTKNSIDIAGLQEVRENQFNALTTPEFGSDVYDIYPAAFDHSPNPVIWNKSKYKLVQPSTMQISYGGNGGHTNIPILKMEDIASGKQFYFANTHDPANVQGNAQDRFDNANAYVAKFDELKAEGLPVIFSGDFNSPYSSGGAGDHTNEPLNGLRENLTYCIVTRNGQLWDSSDAFLYNQGDKTKKGECPSEKAADGKDRPDHIYLSSSLTVLKYFTSPSGENKNGSDVHDTVMASIAFGAEASDESSGGWEGNESAQGFQWPTQRGRLSNCWRKPGHTGIDITTSTGSPVYAAKAGTVVLAESSGDAGNAIMIKHENGLWTNYQHNSQLLVRVGDTVTTGQLIAKSGDTGYSTGPHIHFSVTNAQTLSSRHTGTNTLNPMLFLPTQPSGISGTCSR